jgi:enoyl-CoA hydratase
VSAEPHLLVEREGPLVTLTMNRPEARNALSAEMLGRMVDAWEMIDADPGLRVAILTGAGGHFCAGADLKTMFAQDPSDEWAQRFSTDADLAWKALLRHYRLTKPLIAAVEGYAVAGGTEILQSTDVRIAGESATFGITEVTRGLFPLGGSTVRLRRQIPYAKAMEILLTGRFVPAKEAEEIGLIGRVVPDGQALDEAKEVAALIARNAPLSVQAVKRAVQETEGLPEPEALKVELEIGFPIFTTKDSREGTRAFAEKRPPEFTGE